MNKIVAFFVVLVFAACDKIDNKQNHTLTPKVVDFNFVSVPRDSFPKMEIIELDVKKFKKTKVAKPTILKHEDNAEEVTPSKTQEINSDSIIRIVLGQNGVPPPQLYKPKITTVKCGKPRVVPAGNIKIKDIKGAFASFGAEEGLPVTGVIKVVEDKYGSLWLATLEGLVRYDGKYFTYYNIKQGLLSNTVRDLLIDSTGNIWFLTDKSLSVFNGNVFTHYEINEDFPIIGNQCLHKDKKGNIWALLINGLMKYDGNKFTGFLFEAEKNIYKMFRLITEDNYGNIITIQENGGLLIFNGESYLNIRKNSGLLNEQITSLFVDQQNNIWLGYWADEISVLVYSKKPEKESSGLSYSVVHHFVNKKLASRVVSEISQDNSGNIWISSDDLTKVTDVSILDYSKEIKGSNKKNTNLKFVRFGTADGFSNRVSAMQIFEDKTGNLWLPCFDRGLFQMRSKSFINFNLPGSNTKVGSQIQGIDGEIWIGTNNGIFRLKENELLLYPEVKVTDSYSSISIDTNGIWLGSFDYSKPLRCFDFEYITEFYYKDGKPLTGNDIKHDRHGNHWIITEDAVMRLCINKDKKAFLVKYTFKDYSPMVVGLDNSRFFISTTNLSSGINRIYNCRINDSGEFSEIYLSENSSDITDMVFDNNGGVWMSSFDKGLLYVYGKKAINLTEDDGLPTAWVNSIYKDKIGNLLLGTRHGLSIIDRNSVQELCQLLKNEINSKSSLSGDIKIRNISKQDGLLSIAPHKIVQLDDDRYLMSNREQGLMIYNPSHERTDSLPPNVQVTSLDLFNESIDWRSLEHSKDIGIKLGNGVSVSNFRFNGFKKWYNVPENLSLTYDNNYLTFNFIGITMHQPKNVKYQYMLEGLDENWSAITSKSEAPYGNLPHGNYTFKVKAKNSEGIWSKPFEYKFSIRPPFWKTWWFRTLIGLLIVSSIWYYIKSREKKLVARQQQLEKTVEERTAEVVEQKYLIEEKHKEITDSINYAERIQRSFIATKEILDENLKDYFVLFKPKDVVSGDFYWASKLNNGNFALATADSTGHGVPGAIMSLLNITSLEKAIETLNNPSDILNSTRKTIIERLKKDGSAEGGKDGMDASLTVYDFKNNKLIVAAANNPVWIVRGTEVIEIKADKMPVGKHDKDSVSFTQQEIDLHGGDVVYTLTDGFPDQFGGEKGKKFMSKNLRELLSSNANLSMNEQKELLELTFKNWVGNLEQVDDVCLIGVRI